MQDLEKVKKVLLLLCYLSPDTKFIVQTHSAQLRSIKTDSIIFRDP